MSLFTLFRRIIIHNFKEKLISLLIAMGFWGYFRLAQISNLEISIPVDYTSAPESLVMLSEAPNFINAELTGKENELRFSSANLIAKVDLSAAGPGRNRFMANFDSNQLPSGVKIKSINSEIFLDFDKIISKAIPINIKFSGNLPETFLKGNYKVKPAKVTLTGPQTRLDPLNSLNLKTIDLSTVKKDINAKMGFADLNDPGIEVVPDSVKVFVPVFRYSQSNIKIIEDIPIKVTDTPPGRVAVLDPLDVSLTVRSSEQSLQKLSQRSFLATINISENISKDLFNAKITITKRKTTKVEIIKVDPESVKVRLLRKN